jgi:hypothetical protein
METNRTEGEAAAIKYVSVIRLATQKTKNGRLMNLNMKAAAVLIWLDVGENPALDSFVPQLVQPPPSPNPESWWCLQDAIVYVHEMSELEHGKVPWIKTGDTILGPDQIIQAYNVRFVASGLDPAKGKKRRSSQAADEHD